MYPSAHYLMFVNFDDFKQEITKVANSSTDPTWFFSRYDCDSLALESVMDLPGTSCPFSVPCQTHGWNYEPKA